MPRKKSKTAPEGNGPVPQDTYVLLGGITLEEIRRTRQRSASLEQGARQPCRAIEADVISGKKTRKRAKDAAANQAKDGDSCTAKRVHAGPTSSTSFGMKAEPAALPCRDDAMVDKGTAAPKPYLSPVEMRTPLTDSDHIFRPLPSWTLGEETKGRTNRTNNNQLAFPYWRKVIQMKSR